MHELPVDSVLLLGFGGPTRPEEIGPFLHRVAEGRGISKERLAEVEHHYLEIGGRSPYNEQTEQLRAALEAWLRDHGPSLPVYTGMRNWHPFLADTFRAMHADGRRRCVGVILATHRSEASHPRYLADVARAAEEAGTDAAGLDLLPPWFDSRGFHAAVASRIEEGSPFRRGAWPASVPLVFTAHSIPVRMAESSTYVSDVRRSCEGTARLLGASSWRIAYQSRSGDPRTPWLEPDINDALRDLAAGGAREVVVQAIGFLSDHVEVLYDLDVEARRTASALGLTLHRTPCVGTHLDFVALLGESIQAATGIAA
jgi:protoporphyrin/coproporphyrin ferrochelatase